MLLLFLCAICVSAFAPNQPGIPCSPFTTQDPAGGSYTYDLSSLAIPNPTATSKFPTGTENGAKWTVYLNICGLSSAIGCGMSTPACQNDGAGNFFSLGTASSWTFNAYYEPATPSAPQPKGGVVVTISNGDLCKSSGVFRKAFMFFKCDATVTALPSTFTITEVDPVSQDPSPCVYYFGTMSHQCFCPGGCGGGGGGGGFDYGWIFVIIVLVGLFLYFLIGFLILKFGQHKEGRECVPQHEFWLGLPGLVIDGLKYT